MSKELLQELAGDVVRLMLAGSSAAVGNEALSRQARTLRDLSVKVPSLVPLAETAERAVAAKEAKSAGPALLDLLVAARQARTSLAGSGIEGPLTPVKPSGPWTTPLSIRDLNPIAEALLKSGSGDRESTLTEAGQRENVADLRLLEPMLQTLGSTSGSIADIVATHLLPHFGKAVLPELEQSFQINGKAIDARRLAAIAKIDKKRGAELCREALEKGPVPLRIRALNLMPDVGKPGEAETIGLKFLDDKNADVRQAALLALCHATSDEVLERILNLFAEQVKLSNPIHLWTVIHTLKEMPHPRLTPRLLELWDLRWTEWNQAAQALEQAKKDKRKAKTPAKRGAKDADPVAVAEDKLQRAFAAFVWVVDLVSERNLSPAERVTVAQRLVPLVQHPVMEIADRAIQALGRVGPVIPEVMETFNHILANKKSSSHFDVFNVLSQFTAEQRASALPHLLAIAADEKHLFQDGALELLPDHFAGNEAAIKKVLLDGLKSKKEEVRDDAARAIAAVGQPFRDQIPALVEVMKLLKPYQAGMDHIFFRVDPEGTLAVPALIGLLKEKKTNVLIDVLINLTHYGPKAVSAAPQIEPLTKHRDNGVRHFATQAMTAVTNSLSSDGT